MKKIILSIILLLIINVSCKRTIEIEIPAIKGDPSGAIITTKVISTGDKYVFETDVHVVNERGQFVRNLGKNNFTIKDSTISGNKFGFSLLDLKNGTTSAKGDYSAMLLLDQSGSIVSTDPDDARIDACKIFLNSLGGNDNVGLASFTGNYSNYFQIHQNFSRDIKPMISTLDILSYTEGGGTPLYYSAYGLVDYVDKNAINKSNKALILFTDGDDTNGGRTPTQIIEYANSKNVQIFTVGLGRSLGSLGILADIADKTNGYFMWAQDAKQLISYFGTLGKLLEGNAGYYRMRWELTTAQKLISKRSYLFNLVVKISDNKSVRFAVPITLP